MAKRKRKAPRKSKGRKRHARKHSGESPKRKPSASKLRGKKGSSRKNGAKTGGKRGKSKARKASTRKVSLAFPQKKRWHGGHFRNYTERIGTRRVQDVIAILRVRYPRYKRSGLPTVWDVPVPMGNMGERKAREITLESAEERFRLLEYGPGADVLELRAVIARQPISERKGRRFGKRRK